MSCSEIHVDSGSLVAWLWPLLGLKNSAGVWQSWGWICIFYNYHFLGMLLPTTFSKIWLSSVIVLWKSRSPTLKTDNIGIFFLFVFTGIKLWHPSSRGCYLYCLTVARVWRGRQLECVKASQRLGVSLALSLEKGAVRVAGNHTEMMEMKELEWNLVSEVNRTPISLSPDSIHKLR